MFVVVVIVIFVTVVVVAGGAVVVVIAIIIDLDATAAAFVVVVLLFLLSLLMLLLLLLLLQLLLFVVVFLIDSKLLPTCVVVFCAIIKIGNNENFPNFGKTFFVRKLSVRFKNYFRPKIFKKSQFLKFIFAEQQVAVPSELFSCYSFFNKV